MTLQVLVAYNTIFMIVGVIPFRLMAIFLELSHGGALVYTD